MIASRAYFQQAGAGADRRRTGAPRQAAELLDGDEKQGDDGRSRTRAATGGCKTGPQLADPRRRTVAGRPAAAEQWISAAEQWISGGMRYP